MTIINIKDFPQIREAHKDKKIVFCSGVFDLTHAGHILFFEDCKKHGDILVVAVGRDAPIRERKGKDRPILNQNIRLKTIDSLKPVDYCYVTVPPSNEDKSIFSEPEKQKFLSLEIAFKNLKPDIYILNSDGFDLELRKELADRFNVKLKILERTCPEEFESISTSGIIEKIKNLSK